MRGAWGDFARLCSGEGVDGEPRQPTLVPQYQSVGATSRGRQCSLRRRVPRGVFGWENEGKRLLRWGSGVPFFICAWEVCLKCAAPGAASGSPYYPHPHLSLPGLNAGSCGHREPAHRLRTVRLSAGILLGPGKSSGGVAAVVVCAGREVASGDMGRWAGGPAGGWSGALPGGSVAVEEGWRGLYPEDGLRVTSRLSIWGKGALSLGTRA